MGECHQVTRLPSQSASSNAIGIGVDLKGAHPVARTEAQRSHSPAMRSRSRIGGAERSSVVTTEYARPIIIATRADASQISDTGWSMTATADSSLRCPG